MVDSGHEYVDAMSSSSGSQVHNPLNYKCLAA